jgi:hypothetical protein
MCPRSGSVVKSSSVSATYLYRVNKRPSLHQVDDTEWQSQKREATIHEATLQGTKELNASCCFVLIRGQSISSFSTASWYDYHKKDLKWTWPAFFILSIVSEFAVGGLTARFR